MVSHLPPLGLCTPYVKRHLGNDGATPTGLRLLLSQTLCAGGAQVPTVSLSVRVPVLQSILSGL